MKAGETNQDSVIAIQGDDGGLNYVSDTGNQEKCKD